MLLEPGTGTVGFVLPQQAAAHYRHLYFEYVPLLETQVARCEALVPALEQLADNRRRQLGVLDSLLANRSLALARCDEDEEALSALLFETNAARKSEQRAKRFWRTTTILLAGTAAALALLLAAE
jgi:hypothetical protein